MQRKNVSSIGILKTMYIYTLKKNIVGVNLTLAVDLDARDENIPERFEITRTYISNIIPKIKRLAEELYFD